eukprot:TRINITY_DN91446_c0_g1_i1.p1 TRINITY_DN91446_c0_g1~~TRINITY_DN91446_c0_g1_i1.p1  ORF type:complete len:351 (+),score=87.40 TRINITY_DN91446_c0_g1_i1:49-1101(+)
MWPSAAAAAAAAARQGRRRPILGHGMPAWQLPRSQGCSTTVSTAAESSRQGKDAEEKKKPMGWGMFSVYMLSGATGVTFAYYFYKAKYSFHKTEVLMLDAFRRLPLYWPAGPRAAEVNSRMDAEGLPEDLKVAFCEWFVMADLEEPGGVTRDDVLELMVDMGYGEEAQPAKDFLYRGEGHIEERRRMSCVGLQESLTLLAAMRAEALKKQKQEPADGASDAPSPKTDGEIVELLRRKFRRSVSSLNSGMEALRQVNLMQAPSSLSNAGATAQEGNVQTAASSPSRPVPAAAPTWEDLDDTDEEDLRMEDARLARVEEELMLRLERQGTLSPAEEARLADIRQKRIALKAS